MNLPPLQYLVLLLLMISCYSSEEQSSTSNPVYVPVIHHSNQKGQKVTILTFYIEQDAEQEQDFLEVAFQIQTKSSASLKAAIDESNSIIEKIKKTAESFCENAGGADCEDRVDCGKHQIVAEYQRVRKEEQFKNYVVTVEVTLTIKQTEIVEPMFDALKPLGIYKINSFEWKPFEEVNAEQTAINNGIAQGKGLCERINRRIGQILAIEELYSDDDDSSGAQEQEEEEQEGSKSSVLKFQVECVGRSQQEQAEQGKKEKKKKKKKAE